METLELFCLVCNTKLDVASCVNIFYTTLPRNGTQLGSFILEVLRCLESDLRSSYVCPQCYGFFQMLEQAQWTAANIRTEILKVYELSKNKKNRKKHLNTNRIGEEENVNIFDIDNKCLAKNFKNILNSDAINTNECSIKSEDKFLNIGEVSFNENEVTSVINPNLGKCVSKESGKSVKLCIENSSDQIRSLGNNSKNEEDLSKGKKFQAKIHKSIFGDNDNNHENVSTNHDASNEIFNQNQDIFKGKNTIDSSNDLTTLNLNRQEKMALYTHRCKICGRLFKHINDLESHMLKHTVESQPHKCKLSKERFPNTSETDLSVAQKHRIDKNPADIMPESRDRKLTVLINDDRGIFPEELLGMSDNDEQDDFVWKEAVHIPKKLDKNKEGNESVEISDSSKQVDISTEKIIQKSGRKSKYSLKPLKYPCPTCGKKWRTSTELKIHLKSHSNLRPYMCEKCGQAYKHKHALEIHVGMHNGINPFQCTFCNKCFTQKGALMRHLPMHTGETPYQCELCGKRFVHHTSYNMHALSHTGKKSYQCHVCDLSLLSTSHLKRHMRVHTGEKPFSCTLCGKRFAERYNLIAHQKIHDPSGIAEKETKKTEYKCKQCATLFDSEEELDEHSKSHENLVTEIRSDKKSVVENENDVTTGISKCYVSQNQNQNQNAYSLKLDTRDNIIADQTWQHIGYTKLQSIGTDEKLSEAQSTFHIGTNPLTLGIENQTNFMDIGYNRNFIPNIGISNGNRISIERTET